MDLGDPGGRGQGVGRRVETTYGAAAAGANGVDLPATLTFTPDALIRVGENQYAGVDVTGASPGPYDIDFAEAVLQDGTRSRRAN